MFALRVHFLLWGSFAATVNGVSVTGDYRRTGPPRLVLKFANGEVTIWSASLRILDSADAREEYDFTADILSESWNRRSALRKVKTHGREEIADVLLDQSIFAGVGNIIKNEVLFRTRTSPFTKVSRLSPTQLRRIADEARVFSFRFLELRREFALRKHLEIYGRSTCPSCKGKVSRKVHGERGRRSFSVRFASTRVHSEAIHHARRLRDAGAGDRVSESLTRPPETSGFRRADYQ
jgi:endonuclease-8